MARIGCPYHSRWPSGCRNFIGVGKYNPKGCKFDQTRMSGGNPSSSDPFDRGSYGPFYVTTGCNRIGNVDFSDKYEPSNDFDELAKLIDIGSVINEKIAPRYDWPDKKELNEAMVKIYKAVIAKLK